MEEFVESIGRNLFEAVCSGGVGGGGVASSSVSSNESIKRNMRQTK